MADLKELLGEELAMQVEAKLGDTKLVIGNNGTWLPKEKLDAELVKIGVLNEEIETYKTQLSDLKASTSATDDLKAKIEELQALNETTRNEFENKLLTERKINAVKLNFSDKVHDIETFIKWIDLDQINLDENGNVTTGIKEQEQAIKETKAYIFKPEVITPIIEEEQKPAFKASIGNHNGDSSTNNDDPITAALRKKGLL